ncbi:hypothetical protein [Bradyrhizobium sp. USDA 4451]
MLITWNRRIAECTVFADPRLPSILEWLLHHSYMIISAATAAGLRQAKEQPHRATAADGRPLSSAWLRRVSGVAFPEPNNSENALPTCGGRGRTAPTTNDPQSRTRAARDRSENWPHR